jgi:hypothetical protein
MKRMKFALTIFVILPCLLFLFSCDTINSGNRSPSVLLVTRVTGHTDAGETADFLQSDVFDNPPGTYVADIVSATLEAKLKEPETLGLGPSYQNRIFIHSYDVSYTYIDSTAGIAAGSRPENFTGRLSAGIDIDSSIEIQFVIVREEAKLDTPLINLQLLPLDVLQVLATITFYGEDIAGNPVQATGYLTIYFANYADA